jgi:1,4-dihydroxy-2-naphthoate octaprenyltransferase
LLYVLLVGGAFVLIGLCAVWRPFTLLGLLAAPLAVSPIRKVLSGASGSALIPVLGGTGNLQLAVGFATTIGLALGG